MLECPKSRSPAEAKVSGEGVAPRVPSADPPPVPGAPSYESRAASYFAHHHPSTVPSRHMHQHQMHIANLHTQAKNTSQFSYHTFPLPFKHFPNLYYLSTKLKYNKNYKTKSININKLKNNKKDFYYNFNVYLNVYLKNNHF